MNRTRDCQIKMTVPFLYPKIFIRCTAESIHPLIFSDSIHPLIFPDSMHLLIFSDSMHLLINRRTDSLHKFPQRRVIGPVLSILLIGLTLRQSFSHEF